MGLNARFSQQLQALTATVPPLLPNFTFVTEEYVYC